jgi:hypothetical protein
MRKILSLCIVIAAFLAAIASEKVVQATGMGNSYRAAVNEALITALEKTEGVTLSSTERTDIVSSEDSIVVNGAGIERTQIDDSIKKAMQKWASGKINGYDVVMENYDPSTKKYKVVLSVRMPGAYKVGLDPDNRRRMAVVPFRVMTGDSISWYGQAESSKRWSSILADRINERLTQTRKFTMVDRKFDNEIDNELSRISQKNAAKADVMRFNQKLATDYLVVGTVSFSPVVAPPVNPITGRAMEVESQRFAEISYRVLLAPTGQLKWADNVVIDALECPAADISSFMSASADVASIKIVDAVMASILPFEVVAVTQSGTVVIGEGGKSLVKGERFTVFKLGEMMVDSRTGEQLEEIRESIATVEIINVTPKMSYARVVEGDFKCITKGCVLTRVEVQSTPPPPKPVNTTVKPVTSGGVVVPF